MSTIHQEDELDDASLSTTEREWLERQGRAARALEERQRKAAEAARSAAQLRADRSQRASLSPQR